jgi:hypothetical protein
MRTVAGWGLALILLARGVGVGYIVVGLLLIVAAVYLTASAFGGLVH